MFHFQCPELHSEDDPCMALRWLFQKDTQVGTQCDSTVQGLWYLHGFADTLEMAVLHWDIDVECELWSW